MAHEKLFEEYSKNDLVIWGTGNHAMECREILECRGIKVVAFCDNNSNKWGNLIRGIWVISPQELKELCMKESITLVIASTYYEKIMSQVQEFHCTKVVKYQELYERVACVRIATIFNIEPKKVVKVVEENREALAGAFDDYILYKVVLEERIFEFLPELKPQYNLSVCAIVKDEGKYILEWLEYHIMAGVEHFYLYDNESVDGLYEIIKDFIDKNIVTYISFPGITKQLEAYNHAVNKYRCESKYIAFIDADEFLVSTNGEDVFSVIDEIFHEHLCAGGIGVNWRTYGTSFHVEPVDGYVIENYEYRAEDFHAINKHIKTISNPRRIIDFPQNPHAARYMEPYHCISENGSFIPDAFFYDGMCRKLRLNHYLTKSENEFRAKRMRGRADLKVEYTDKMIERELEGVNRYNEVYDGIMSSWVQKMKGMNEET